MKEIIIERVEPTFYLQEWEATRDGKIYDIIFSKYLLIDMPLPKDTLTSFISDGEFTLSVAASFMALEFKEEDRKRLFNNYIDTFERVKSKTPKPSI